ncbi:asparagine synthase (glutamine-hydrolyzing) [Candidatus Omnitrophota bacterium]
MCGICGIYNLGNGNPADIPLLKRMRDIMRHRGPDDQGDAFFGISGARYDVPDKGYLPSDFRPMVALGHRRLSIIDLSDAGHQPMTNEDDTVWIVCNGEIYNFKELRDELAARGHRFRSHSDTEVIIHAYEQWGKECLHRLIGMFAFAIWDTKKKIMFAARDRLGIKPFYYHYNGKRFVFASEIKAILEDASVDRKPDHSAIYDYLRHMYTVNDNTFFSAVKKLLPGNYLIMEGGSLSVKEYWDVRFVEDEVKNERYYIERCLDLLEDSVRIHLRSDVPVGSHLSGGLDTSCLVALATRMLPHKLNTFSGFYAEDGPMSDAQYIRIMADKYGTRHHEVVPSARDHEDMLERIVWHLDEPAVGSSVIGQYYVCKLASESVKVILGGQGADEIFGGYYRYVPAYLKYYMGRLLSGAGSIREAPETLSNLCRYIGIVGPADVFQKAKRRKGILGITTADFIRSAQAGSGEGGAYPGRAMSRINALQYWDIKHYLPALLHLEDRTSMAVSIESRVPFLDHRIVEFCAAIPASIRMKGLALKHVEREMAKKILPPEVANRKSKGVFSPPIRKWFKEDLFGLVRDIVNSGSFRKRGIFDTRLLERHMKDFIDGRIDYSEQLWMVLNVELWHRQFIDRNSRSRAIGEHEMNPAPRRSGLEIGGAG